MLTFFTRFFILFTASFVTLTSFAGNLKVTLLRDLHNDHHLIAQVEDGRLYSLSLSELNAMDDLSPTERKIIQRAALKKLNKINLHDQNILSLIDVNELLPFKGILDLLDRGETTILVDEKENSELETDPLPKKIGIKCDQEPFSPITRTGGDVAQVLSLPVFFPEEHPPVPNEFLIRIKIPGMTSKKAQGKTSTVIRFEGNAILERDWKKWKDFDLLVLSCFDLNTVGNGISIQDLADRLGIEYNDIYHIVTTLELPPNESKKAHHSTNPMKFNKGNVRIILKELHRKVEQIQEEMENSQAAATNLAKVKKPLKEVDPAIFDRFDFQIVGIGLSVEQFADALGITRGEIAYVRALNPKVRLERGIPRGGRRTTNLYKVDAIKIILERLKEKAKTLKEIKDFQ